MVCLISMRLRALLGSHDRSEGLPLVAVQAANNETGVLQPIAAIGALVKEFGGIFVVDAVQAAGRIPLDITTCSADYLILSSHKIGGPKGVGAIVAISDLVMPKALVRGGGQEKGHRAGTEALPIIAGFGAAARVARERLNAGGWHHAKSRDDRAWYPGDRARRNHLWRGGGPVTEHDVFLAGGNEGGNGANRF